MIRAITNLEAEQNRQLGEVLLAAREAAMNPHATPAGLNTDIDSEGGAAVPVTHVSRLIDKVYNTGEIMRRVDRIQNPPTGDVQIPFIDESNRTDNSHFGGVTAAWVREGNEISDSKPAVGLESMPLSKVASLGYFSNEFLDDSNPGALGEAAMRLFPRELTYCAERAIVRGTGMGQPLGLLNSPCKITVNKITNQPAETVQGDNVVQMLARFWGPSWRTGCWLFNQELINQLSSLIVERGYGSSVAAIPAGPLWNWDGNARSGGWPTLCGMPAIPVEYASAPGTEGDLILTDLSQYIVADKFRESFSSDLRFIYDEGAFRVVWRINGQPTWASALTPDNGTATLSPVVTLETRS